MRMFDGHGGHHGHRGGSGHPVHIEGTFERRTRKGSHRLFREFIRKKGIFGARKTPEEIEREEQARREEEEKRPGTPKPRKSYIVRYVREFRDQKARLLLLLGMSVLGTLLHAAFPLSGKFIIDFVLTRRDFALLLGSCILLFVVGMGEVILQMVRDYTTRTLLGNFSVGIRRRMMRHLQLLPLQRLQDLKVGGIISRLQSDTENLGHLLQEGLLSPFNSLLMFVVGLTSLFILSWQVTLVCLGFCFVMGVVAYFMFNVMRPFYRILREARAVISGHLTEMFGGIQVVRAFRQERAETKDFSLETDLLWRQGLHGSVIGMLIHRTVYTLFWLLRIAIWLYGGYQVILGKMSLGTLVAFGSFIQWLFQPIFTIMHSLSHLQTSLACAERVFDLFDEPAGMPDKEDAVEVTRLQRQIAFENVTFRYPDGTQALTNVDFLIPRGKVTALVGPSGAGKSTVTNLVMRFYDVSEGRITLDGIDIRDTKLLGYRKLLSLVLQDVFLFDGTIRENIAYGRPGAAQEEIEEAARISNCYEFIAKLEKGYESVIGERGIKLSGGQKQRVALARAVLVDPQLLILDEATSNLDSESEALIQDALKQILKGRTTLVIAHRLSTIMDADNIIVMEDSRIVEEGTHDELLLRKGRYYDMFTKQMEKTGLPEDFLVWEEERSAHPNGWRRAKAGRSKVEDREVEGLKV
ncbi:MAG: ABC transporter ATP-binding protein [Kiritimatiellae bacterium]|nr:ABC transporter ATP-binding protein [Kiritimatiellia bacterium]